MFTFAYIYRRLLATGVMHITVEAHGQIIKLFLSFIIVRAVSLKRPSGILFRSHLSLASDVGSDDLHTV